MDEHASNAPGLQQCTALHDLCSLLAILLDFKTLELATDGFASGALVCDAKALFRELKSTTLGAQNDLLETELAQTLEAAEETARATGTLVAVRREHTRLFENPERPELPFYEGAFINRRFEDEGREAPDHDLLFVNQAALDAERQYRHAGLERDLASGNIPADCIVTELQFLQHLFARKAAALHADNLGELVHAEAALVEFARLHVKSWMGAFFERLTLTAQTPHFKAAGHLGTCLLAALKDAYPEAFERHAGRGRS